jgi:PadR family transcriptional regulator, regulatory protein PadR
MSRPAALTLPPKEALILELLVLHGEMYGLELVTASDGSLKRGTVYVTLGRMEDKGLIKSGLVSPPADEGGLPRRLYAPTAAGRRARAAWIAWTRATRQLTTRFIS